MDKSTAKIYPVNEKAYPSATEFDRDHILNGLKKLGIDSSYSIAIYQTNDVVAVTAAEVLTRFFKKAGIDIKTKHTSSIGDREIILILNDTSAEQKALFEKNKLVTLKYDKADDVSHVVKDGNNIIIAGSNGRGVLYGEYEFENFVMYSDSSELNIVKTWDYRTRGQSLGFYWNNYENFKTTEVTRERIEYLSRLGTNLFFPCFDGSGYRTLFMEVVKSDIFPFQDDPNQEFIDKLNRLIPLLAKYGIDYYHWFTEPGTPDMMGKDLSKYTPDMLGHCSNWQGDLTTFCINNPTVQAYYAEMVTKFIRKFPDCKGFILYNLDCGAWFCNTAECENCKKVVSPESLGRADAWENVSKMVTILTDAALKEKPDFNVVFWPNIHHSGEELDKLLKYSHYTALWGGWTGTDHDVIITDKARMVPNVEKQFKAAKERNIPFFCGNIMNRSESIPQGFFYPFAVIKQLQWLKLDQGYNCSIESTGPNPCCNTSTAIAMSNYWSDASLDPDKFVMSLMEAQFGKKAAPFMFDCAKTTDNALQVWHEYEIFTHPLGGSKSFHNISDILNYPQPIEPDLLVPYARYGMFVTDEKYIANFLKMSQLLEKAADAADKAAEVASSSEFIRYAYFESDKEQISRPTCKDYAVMNAATTRFASLVGYQRVNIDNALILLSKLKQENLDESTKKDLTSKYHDILRADVKLQEKVRDFYKYHLDNNTYFLKNYSRVRLESLLSFTEQKIEKDKKQLENA